MKRFTCALCACLILIFSIAPAYAASYNGDTTVYVTRTGECYHRGSCSYLSQSKYSISLQSAVSQGYRACSRCNPPVLHVSSASTSSSGSSALTTVGIIAISGTAGYLLGRRKRR
ncbi:MAG: LPXTG cell wall anchor domain-containing protein [Oscillospiraceae bacterium]|nr:LPXTG cell wall anchor domain-containing protein [Oscillospiraceae bacterium]